MLIPLSREKYTVRVSQKELQPDDFAFQLIQLAAFPLHEVFHFVARKRVAVFVIEAFDRAAFFVADADLQLARRGAGVTASVPPGQRRTRVQTTPPSRGPRSEAKPSLRMVASPIAPVRSAVPCGPSQPA